VSWVLRLVFEILVCVRTKETSAPSEKVHPHTTGR
jgi:hypothetical protein